MKHLDAHRESGIISDAYQNVKLKAQGSMQEEFEERKNWKTWTLTLNPLKQTNTFISRYSTESEYMKIHIFELRKKE